MTVPAGAEPVPVEPAGGSAVRAAFQLTLYVAGPTVRSAQAATALRQICARLGQDCVFTIVDVLERPELAEEEKILATPTVVRQWPLPSRRVIGDLADTDKVVLGLDLPHVAAQAEQETAP
jgi:circadian clock protein KaiB